MCTKVAVKHQSSDNMYKINSQNGGSTIYRVRPLISVSLVTLSTQVMIGLLEDEKAKKAWPFFLTYIYTSAIGMKTALLT